MFEAHTQVTIYYTLLSFFVLSISLIFVNNPRMIKAQSSLIVSILALFCILFIGWRDWRAKEVFYDSLRYGVFYLNFAYQRLEDVKDVGFYILQKICTELRMSVDAFFITCAVLYVVPQIIVAKRISKEYAFIIVLMIITGMGFYSYGVNGIRNGLAFSFLLLTFVNYEKKISVVIFAAIAILFHKSAILPILAFICARLFNKTPKIYLIAWILAIPLSFVVKEFVSDLILSIDFISDRADGYLTNEADADTFSNVGFRYDFVLYSSVPVVVGWYFLKIKKFEDKFYRILYCTYLFANACWVLINYVPYSNRFAALSWFMMPLLLIYPFIFYPKIKYRHLKMTGVLIAQWCFMLIIK